MAYIPLQAERVSVKAPPIRCNVLAGPEYELEKLRAERL